MEKVIKKIKWSLAQWFGSTAKSELETDTRYANKYRPQSFLARTAQRLTGKTGHEKSAKEIAEFHHRGAYSRRESRARHTPKGRAK